MALGTTAWIVMPLVGGCIGYITNRLAVAMIFRPVEPRRFLGLRIQGLVPRRKPDLARSIGRVVGAHLLNHEDIVRAMGSLDVEGLIERAIERGLEPKIAELRRIPLLGNFLTDERVADIRRSLSRGLTSDTDGLVEEFERAIEEGLDVQRELSKLQADIESIQGRIKFLEETAAFSLVNVSLRLAPWTCRWMPARTRHTASVSSPGSGRPSYRLRISTSSRLLGTLATVRHAFAAPARRRRPWRDAGLQPR